MLPELNVEFLTAVGIREESEINMNMLPTNQAKSAGHSLPMARTSVYKLLYTFFQCVRIRLYLGGHRSGSSHLQNWRIGLESRLTLGA